MNIENFDRGAVFSDLGVLFFSGLSVQKFIVLKYLYANKT